MFFLILQTIFLLNIVSSIYGNIIDCYLDKESIFKYDVVTIARKLELILI